MHSGPITRVTTGVAKRAQSPNRKLLEHLIRRSGQSKLPKAIVVDNGPEFTSKALLTWAERQGVRLHFIEPGRPMQNAFIESINGKVRTECLNQHWFLGLSETRERIEAWRQNYNRERPHSALGYVAPHTYLQMWAQQPTSRPIALSKSVAQQPG